MAALNRAWTTNDNWMTPKSAWEDIKDYIPKVELWEAFYGDGESGRYLTELGFDTVHENIDFFKNDRGACVVSNPPFTLIPQVLERLLQINKPFILIMPSSKINTQYFRNLFAKQGDQIQIIIPKKRIQFMKMVNGVVDPKQKKACAFDCFYYCWKIGLSRDITWL